MSLPFFFFSLDVNINLTFAKDFQLDFGLDFEGHSNKAICLNLNFWLYVLGLYRPLPQSEPFLRPPSISPIYPATSFPIHDKKSHCMMLPPPCFSVRMVRLGP
ncbi:hypothetical protein CHARACLAT_005989 [Characodon lateralis]|uniref:Uncharacterized protein n=1 Tax=Characodon lateralis TaxID=208331 RepID=A0ABU7CV78_9TELE|nr:hypothetical protein [Characodon lateralis]